MKPAATPADRNKASAPAPARFGRPMAGTARRDLPNAVLVDAQGSGCSRSHASTGGRRTGTSTSKQATLNTHTRTHDPRHSRRRHVHEVRARAQFSERIDSRFIRKPSRREHLPRFKVP